MITLLGTIPVVTVMPLMKKTRGEASELATRWAHNPYKWPKINGFHLGYFIPKKVESWDLITWFLGVHFGRDLDEPSQLLNLDIQVQKCLAKFKIAIMYCSYMMCTESAEAETYVGFPTGFF